MLAFRDDELLAKGEVLQPQVLSRMKKTMGGSDPDLEKFEEPVRVKVDLVFAQAPMALVSKSDG